MKDCRRITATHASSSLPLHLVSGITSERWRETTGEHEPFFAPLSPLPHPLSPIYRCFLSLGFYVGRFHSYRWPLFPPPLLHPSLLLLPPRLHLLLCVLTCSLFLCARASLHFHTRGATQKTIFEESFRRTVLASQFKPWHHRVAVFVKIVSQHL